MIGDKRLRIFKAGSGTYVYQKLRKNKEKFISKTNIFDVMDAKQNRYVNIPSQYNTR